MPFVPPALLGAAVDALKGKHPLVVLVLPSMMKAGVPIAATAATAAPYGSGDENKTLEAYFREAGGPPGTPFRAVWEAQPDNYWRDIRYAGRSLQRSRTDRVKANSAFFQTKLKPTDLWTIRPSIGADLHIDVPDPIRLIDLAIWYGRRQDVADVDALLAWFLAEFPLDKPELVPSLYTKEIPEHYRPAVNPLAQEQLTQAEVADAIGAAVLPPSYTGALGDLARAVEDGVTSGGFVTSPRFVTRVIASWLRGDMVILVGQPGTGKTMFSDLVGPSLEAVLGPVSVTTVRVRADFDHADLVGYEGLDGAEHLRDFAVRVLCSDDPLAVHLVVLDEFNLTPVETYLASVLSALEARDRGITLPAGGSAYLPFDTFILATCNSYLDEPETRVRVSYPTKRRAAVITMPNVLLERYLEVGDSAFVDQSVHRIEAEAAAARDRIGSGRGTAVDAARLAALETVKAGSDLSPEVRETLKRTCRAVFEQGGQQLQALVPQLRGPRQRADELLAAAAGLPNVDLIERQMSRMMSGAAGDLIPFV